MIRIPIGLKLLALVMALTSFYTFVGQMVPQKEVHPPEVVEIAEDVSAEEMVRIGQEIFEGKGTCKVCHTIDSSSDVLRFPDLGGIGSRAGDRIAGMDALTYLTQSLYEPNVYVVEGFSPGMPPVTKPPIGLTEAEILAVIAYLQSLGGEPTVTMATRLPLAGSGDAEAEAAMETVEASVPDEEPVAVATASIDGNGNGTGGNLENGQQLYSATCVVCHGDRAQGNPALNSPRLAGQESWYIERQLRNFISGARGSDPSDIFGMQMRPMAMTLRSDQDIVDVAAYLSSLSLN